MLEQVIFTALVIWTTNKTPTPCTFLEGYPHACYAVDTNTIYVSKDIKGRSRYFALFHEAGHSLYKENFPRDIFKATPFDTEEESMANDFGWWMYGKKYPDERVFVNKVISKNKRQFFADTCAAKCQRDILKIK